MTRPCLLRHGHNFGTKTVSGIADLDILPPPQCHILYCLYTMQKDPTVTVLSLAHQYAQESRRPRAS